MMLARLAKRCSGRVHYAWVVLGVAFLAALSVVGVRSAPGVMIVPLQRSFGWDVGTISGAVSVNILLLGILGPFIMALMERFGLKNIMVGCMLILMAATGLSVFMTEPWQLFLTWGVMVGIGSAAGSIGLATAVANRWFHTNRGLAVGLLTAANAMGQLIFLPALAALANKYGWEGIAVFVTLAIAVIIPPVWLLLPETPAAIGLAPLGGVMERTIPPERTGNPFALAFTGLGQGVRSLDFWLLGITFAICGFSTQGLVGTHLVAYCVDNGISEVGAAGFLAFLGVFNLIGSGLSGWLTDRMNPRVLMFWLFGLRGIALFLLPLTGFDIVSLSVFTVFYGLNWVAIVPPQYAIINDVFGKKAAPVIISWVFVLHQVGGAAAAFGAGYLRDYTGSYLTAFMLAGVACFLAAIMVLRVSHARPAEALAGP